MSTEKKKQGFASLSPEQHRAISAKGGSAKGKPKGYATMSPEQRSEASKIASRARWDRVKAERLESEQI